MKHNRNAATMKHTRSQGVQTTPSLLEPTRPDRRPLNVTYTKSPQSQETPAMDGSGFRNARSKPNADSTNEFKSSSSSSATMPHFYLSTSSASNATPNADRQLSSNDSSLIAKVKSNLRIDDESLLSNSEKSSNQSKRTKFSTPHTTDKSRSSTHDTPNISPLNETHTERRRREARHATNIFDKSDPNRVSQMPTSSNMIDFDMVNEHYDYHHAGDRTNSQSRNSNRNHNSMMIGALIDHPGDDHMSASYHSDHHRAHDSQQTSPAVSRQSTDTDENNNTNHEDNPINLERRRLIKTLDDQIKLVLHPPNTGLRRSERLRLKKLKKLQEERTKLLDEIFNEENINVHVFRVNKKFITKRNTRKTANRRAY